MRTDVSVTYEDGRLRVLSEAAGYSESRPAVIVLSRGADGVEVPEAIGQPFDLAMRKAAWERDEGARTYRAFDPFAAHRFEPDAAAMMVIHLCYMAHGRISPKRGLWRAQLRLERFTVRLRIADYQSVPAEKRVAFERQLRKNLGKVEVGV